MKNGNLYKRDEELESEFNAMIGLMAEMITTQAMLPPMGQMPPQWSYDLHDLSMKLFKHLCSSRTLLEPCPFGTPTHRPFGYIDHSSIAVLTRSSIENYLVMHWIFKAESDSRREFNHRIWVYSGWKKRTKLFAGTPEAREATLHAEENAAGLLSLIETSPIYQGYDSEKRKKVRKGLWDVDWTWKDLAKEAGLHHTYFASIYPYLSGYTHSDFISALQVGQAKTLQDQYMLGVASISTNLMILGHFTYFYAEMFPTAKAVLEKSAAKALVDRWHLRAEDMNFLYEK
ncbi:DUF5677 domain-containing protein [Pseudomonas sp. RW3S2]|uniref:DUF5677 domain-containing protein n=1 Tax=Pseudomonas sp. RW3S2 TaxID=485884 RepID=UPI0016455532|nr:DUF5677 domain-containing protein [Pseudomonas sp. RW3S2]MBC3419998.1 hypothetical protein [Pseudomonas sp. RW3S2]